MKPWQTIWNCVKPWKLTWSCTEWLSVVTKGYRRLPGGSDHFSLQTHKQTLHHNIYIIINSRVSNIFSAFRTAWLNWSYPPTADPTLILIDSRLLWPKLSRVIFQLNMQLCNLILILQIPTLSVTHINAMAFVCYLGKLSLFVWNVHSNPETKIICKCCRSDKGGSWESLPKKRLFIKVIWDLRCRKGKETHSNYPWDWSYQTLWSPKPEPLSTTVLCYTVAFCEHWIAMTLVVGSGGSFDFICHLYTS